MAFFLLSDSIRISFSGKTYTMVGTRSDPGLMVLSLNTIFDMIKSDKSSDEFEVSCSYLEVYNEVRHLQMKLVLVSSIFIVFLPLRVLTFSLTRLSTICLKNPLVIWSLERIPSRE